MSRRAPQTRTRSTTSYLELSRTDAGVSGRRIAVADLDGTLGLDDDGDGRVSPAELSS